MRQAALAALVCLLVLAGCTAWQQPVAPALLPVSDQIKLDQLVIESNFRLPSHHRLLEELNAQRTDLSSRLAIPVSDEPIYVYLFETEERYAEFLRVHYPQFPQRRSFFLETDTRLMVYARWGDRIAEDLRHEVCHGYLHSVIPKIPLWLDEGLAEYFEVQRGHHGINQPHIEELARRWKEGSWRPDLQRLESLASPGDMTQLDYAEAWAWTHMLLDTTQPRREVLQSYLSAVRREGVAEPLSLHLRTLGIEPQQTLGDYILWLHSRPAQG